MPQEHINFLITLLIIWVLVGIMKAVYTYGSQSFFIRIFSLTESKDDIKDTKTKDINKFFVLRVFLDLIIFTSAFFISKGNLVDRKYEQVNKYVNIYQLKQSENGYTFLVKDGDHFKTYGQAIKNIKEGNVECAKFELIQNVETEKSKSYWGGEGGTKFVSHCIIVPKGTITKNICTDEN